MQPDFITADSIAAAFAFVVSVASAFFPGVRAKFVELASEERARVIFGLCVAVAIGMIALACFGVDTGLGAVCPAFGLQTAYDFLRIVLVAAGTAQSTFVLLVKPIQKRLPLG